MFIPCQKNYYDCILRSHTPELVERTKRSEEYEKLAKTFDDAFAQAVEVEVVAQDDGDIFSEHDGSQLWDTDEEMEDPMRPEPEQEEPDRSSENDDPSEDHESSASTSDSGVPDIGSESDPGDVMPPFALPFTYQGITFEFAAGFDKPMVLCGCTLDGHKACKKHRGVSDRQTGAFGPWEPVAFLLAWRRGGPKYLTSGAHIHGVVPFEDVAAAFEELRVFSQRATVDTVSFTYCIISTIL